MKVYLLKKDFIIRYTTVNKGLPSGSLFDLLTKLREKKLYSIF